MNAETEQKIKLQILRCGNNAHDMKNILYQIHDDQIPEILILVDEASRIEGLCHDIVRTNLNFRYLSYFEGWKVALRKLKRHIKISLKIIKTGEESQYRAFSNEVQAQLENYLQLEEELVENVDSYLNKLFIQFTDGNCEQIKYTDSFSNQLYDEMDFDTLNEKQLNESTIKQLNDLVQTAIEACNRAHNIQNYIVPYQVKQGYEGHANTIIGYSGEVEQQFREIQKNLMMHNHNLIEMKNNIKSHSNYAKSKLSGILDSLSYISKDTKFNQEKSIKSICSIIEESCNFFNDKITDQMIEVF